MCLRIDLIETVVENALHFPLSQLFFVARGVLRLPDLVEKQHVIAIGIAQRRCGMKALVADTLPIRMAGHMGIGALFQVAQFVDQNSSDLNPIGLFHHDRTDFDPSCFKTGSARQTEENLFFQTGF